MQIKKNWKDVTGGRRLGALAAVGVALAPWAPARASEAPGEVAEPVAHVGSVSGSAFAVRAGEQPRPLDCHDAVYAGEKVVTHENSGVSLVVGDVLAQLDEKSELELGHGASEAPTLGLEAGGVRVIDPRPEGEPVELEVLSANASIVGNDTEAYVFYEKTGGYAVFCEWDTPLPVSRGEEGEVAPPGRCVISKPKERLYTADAHEERMAVPEEIDCTLRPLIGQLEMHLDPSDVAAGPDLRPWSDVAPTLAMPPRSPCDLPGSGCLTANEPPATTGPVPGGGGGTFPGP